MNNLDLCQLPYIELPEIPNSKFLIDSGSTRSLIKYETLHNCHCINVYTDPFGVRTAHGSSSHYLRSKVKFKSLCDEPLEFCIFNFNDNYDGLIGMDFLRKYKATLDFKLGLLILSNKRVLDIDFPYDYTIPALMEETIDVPVDKPNGYGLIESMDINNIYIPDCLIECNNNKASIKVINPTNKPIDIKFRAPVQTKDIIDVNNFQNNRTMRERSRENWIASQIRTQHLNTEEKEYLIDLCKEYNDIFANENEPLTSTNVVKHKIRTTDEIPIHSKLYRYPYIHKEEVDSQIDKMLRQNIIRHSHSPWCSPIWVVPKKPDASGKKKWRIVVDYRKLNEKTIPDRYPIPKIEEILDKIGRSQYFSTIDLFSGFHQIEIEPNDIEKTAFSTDNGHYEYLKMPFGLNNAPATFQRLMNHVLHGLIGKTCLVYMDDVIVFSTSLQEHIEKLSKVFDRFRKCKLKIQLDKSDFLRKEAEFLGHVVTPQGIKPNPKKIEAIYKYPIPKTTKEIKSFLGLIGYYRKFIKNFADITKPLTKCLKKNAKIDTNNEEYVEAFETCKSILMNSPILQPPNFDKPFILTTDASNVAVGAVLSQVNSQSDLPVAFASRTLNETESRYSTVEKELLAIVWATSYFRPYLYGKRFIIRTDHKPLKWLFSLKHQNSKLLRWRLKLEEYEYDIEYKKGKNNNVADALSRIEIHPLDIDNQSIINNVDENEVRQEDEVIELDSDTANSNQESYSAPGMPILEEEIINNKPNQIIFDNTNGEPEITHLRMGKRNCIHAKINLNNPKNIEEFIKQYCLPQKKYYCLFWNENDYERVSSAINQCFNNVQAPLFYRCLKILEEIPDDELRNTIQRFHEGKSNHRGLDETYLRMKQKYYYPNLKEHIQKYLEECAICKQCKYERHNEKIGIELTPTPQRPLEVIHIDTFQIENTSFLTFLDPFSKFGQAYNIRGKTAIEITRNLIKFFSHYGSPKLIISDSGTEFANETVKELLESYQINLHLTTPQNPNSNGPVERFHSTLIEQYRIFKLKYDKLKPQEIIPFCVFAYNSSIHSQTLKTPFDLIFGFIPEMHNYNPDAIITQEYNEKHKALMKITYAIIKERIESSKNKTLDRNNKDSNQPFKEGDVVYKRIPPGFHKKHKNPFTGPYTIISLLEHNKALIINHKTDEQLVTHLRNLRLSGGHTSKQT